MRGTGGDIASEVHRVETNRVCDKFDQLGNRILKNGYAEFPALARRKRLFSCVEHLYNTPGSI